MDALPSLQSQSTNAGLHCPARLITSPQESTRIQMMHIKVFQMVPHERGMYYGPIILPPCALRKCTITINSFEASPSVRPSICAARTYKRYAFAYRGPPLTSPYHLCFTPQHGLRQTTTLEAEQEQRHSSATSEAWCCQTDAKLCLAIHKASKNRWSPRSVVDFLAMQ